jgi:hypothetical protein
MIIPSSCCFFSTAPGLLLGDTEWSPRPVATRDSCCLGRKSGPLGPGYVTFDVDALLADVLTDGLLFGNGIGVEPDPLCYRLALDAHLLVLHRYVLGDHVLPQPRPACFAPLDADVESLLGHGHCIVGSQPG